MRVWIVTMDDRETPLDDTVLGVFASQEAALEWAVGPENADTVEAAGGLAVPDAPWESDGDPDVSFALMAGELGSSMTVRPWEVRG